jgi:hypothetical protein
MFGGKRFYEEQIDYLIAGRTDDLIDTHDHPDAATISLDAVVRGNEALKNHFRTYVQRLGNWSRSPRTLFADAGDAILLEAHVQTSLGEFAVYDAFVPCNGKTAHRFTGVK